MKIQINRQLMPIGELGMMAANAFGGAILGEFNDSRQLRQQEALQGLQIKGQKEMTDYNAAKQYEMWEKTNYDAQVKQMNKAGINPALLYGKGGAGGQSVNVSGGQVTGGQAPQGGGEIQNQMSMGMELALLMARKDNIEADTENKKASSEEHTANAEGKGLENAMTAYLNLTTPDGEDIPEEHDKYKSVRAQNEITKIKESQANKQFKLDENARQELMNNVVMKEIGAKISLMASQGQTQEQIYKNLVKEGDLLDAEIEWNKMDIEGGNIGKFITNIIKMLFKPK